jgi:hypothetical protein
MLRLALYSATQGAASSISLIIFAEIFDLDHANSQSFSSMVSDVSTSSSQFLPTDFELTIADRHSRELGMKPKLL